MTLYEWIHNDLLYAPTQPLQAVQSLFNNENNSYFIDWFAAEFFNYNLLFDSDTFAFKLIAFFSNKAVEIDRIQKLTNFLKNKGSKEWTETVLIDTSTYWFRNFNVPLLSWQNNHKNAQKKDMDLNSTIRNQ